MDFAEIMQQVSGGGDHLLAHQAHQQTPQTEDGGQKPAPKASSGQQKKKRKTPPPTNNISINTKKKRKGEQAAPDAAAADPQPAPAPAVQPAPAPAASALPLLGPDWGTSSWQQMNEIYVATSLNELNEPAIHIYCDGKQVTIQFTRFSNLMFLLNSIDAYLRGRGGESDQERRA